MQHLLKGVMSAGHSGRYRILDFSPVLRDKQDLLPKSGTLTPSRVEPNPGPALEMKY